MAYLRYTVTAVFLASALGSSANRVEHSVRRVQLNQPANTKEFADVAYGYSIRFPTGWKPYTRTPKGEPPQRLSLSTPNRNTLIISVSRLPRTVTLHSEFEQIGQDHVESVVNAYLKSFDITSIGDKKEDHSDQQSMRFWQGTSGFHASVAPAMLISLHAIRYGSHFMVNVVYVSGQDSKEEVAALDAAMNSLSFASR